MAGKAPVKRIAVAITIYVTTSVIVTALLRWHAWRVSPWRRVPASTWEQLAAQMRHGAQPVALDATMVLADLDAWLADDG